MSNMLEQALIDAEALKEAAYKKAEAALLENAKPQIEEAVKQLLEQDDEMSSLDMMDAGGLGDAPDMGSGEVGGLADNLSLGIQGGEKMCACPEEDEEVEIDFAELERQMVADEAPEEDVMGQDDLAQGLNLSGPEDDLGVPMGGEDEEELDLDEDLLSALLEEIQPPELGKDAVNHKEHEGDCEKEHPGMTHAEFMHKGKVEEGGLKLSSDFMKRAKERHKKSSKHPYKVPTPDTSVPEDTTDEAKMTPAMKAAAYASPEAKSDYLKDKGVETDQDEKDLERMRQRKREKEAGDSGLPDWMTKEELEKTIREMVRASTQELTKVVEQKEKEIKKLNSYVHKLSESLKETNLQNARLLYTNKILESVSLNERQKVKIVEAVSKAGSVEEAKIIYETLITNSVGLDKKERPKSLNEAVERRSTPMFPRKNPEKTSSNAFASRMKELAGIKD